MEENEKTFEAYFSGRMSSAQANDFHTALKHNPEFEKKYNEFLAIKEASSTIERDNLRQLLNDVEINDGSVTSSQSKSSPTKIIPLFKKVVGIAALFLLGFWGLQVMSADTPEELFAQNFEIYDAQATRGESSDAIKSAYNSGNYDTFILRASEMAESPEINMMLASAYMKTSKWTKALYSLSKISDDSSLRDQKYWYLALVNLKTENLEEAIKHLQYLKSISNFKKSEIDEILSVIRT